MCGWMLKLRCVGLGAALLDVKNGWMLKLRRVGLSAALLLRFGGVWVDVELWFCF